MCKIINDFMVSGKKGKGYGFFEGENEVLKYASPISKSALRKYQRYGDLPSNFAPAFEKYLKDHLNFVHRDGESLADFLDDHAKRNKDRVSNRREELEKRKGKFLEELLDGKEKQLINCRKELAKSNEKRLQKRAKNIEKGLINQRKKILDCQSAIRDGCNKGEKLQSELNREIGRKKLEMIAFAIADYLKDGKCKYKKRRDFMIEEVLRRDLKTPQSLYRNDGGSLWARLQQEARAAG
jgi:hypothetical protein